MRGMRFFVLSLVSIFSFFSCSGGMQEYSSLIQEQIAPVGENSLRSLTTVSTSGGLALALDNAQAGDTILLEPGEYTASASTTYVPTGDGGTTGRTWFFRGSANGNDSAKITLKSADPSNPAILSGTGWNDSGYVLWITGDYWVIENIVVKSGAKGIILDNSNNSLIFEVEIFDIGQEGLHVRDGSCNTVVDGLNLHDVGKENDGFGEGVYIGSDNSVWWEGDGDDTGEKGLLYSREVHNTVVKNSTIGPNITAEPFDIKEGSSDTIIENNTIYGSGVSGENYADSHIDVKGYDTIIRYNHFYQDGNDKIARGIMVVPRSNAGVDSALSAHDIYIHGNTFYFESDADDVECAVANSGSEDVYAWDNTRDPSDGNLYDSRIIQSIPSGYDPGDYPDDYETIVVNCPSVDAGSDQSLAENTTSTQLSGTASDPDGLSMSYQWSMVDGLSSAAIGSPSSLSTTVSNLTSGTYSFQLSATNSAGETGTDTISVVVAGTAAIGSSPLVLEYDCNEPASSSKTIEFDIRLVNSSESSENLDGYSVRYWFSDDSLNPVYSERYISIGSSNTDGSFGTAEGMDFCEINFTGGTIAGNDDEKIKISINDSSFAYFDQTNDYSFEGSMTSFGENTHITLYQDGALVWGDPGTDNGGTVVINDPVVNAGADLSLDENTTSTQLVGTASDPDDLSMSYQWSQESGPSSATFGNPTSLSTSVSNLTSGTYSFKLSATNSAGGTGTDSVQVVVEETAVVIGNSPLELQYECDEEDSSSDDIKFNILLVNPSDATENLDGYSIRYWFSDDSLSYDYSERYISIGSENTAGTFGAANGEDYLEIIFSGGSVSHNDEEKIKITIAASSGDFNQTNDYSFDGEMTSFGVNTHVTLYQNDELVWGIEP